MKYLLDTHVWVWLNASPNKLSAKVKTILEQQSDYQELLLSAISVWELCKLIEKGRLKLSCQTAQWIEQALDFPKLRLVELSPEVSLHSTNLPESLHQDPADQIVVATARLENATIITKDKLLSAYQHVKTFW